MKFGVNPHKKLSGAEISVRAAQLISLLPVVYIFLCAGILDFPTRYGFFSFLNETALASMPRLFTLGVSWFYRLTGSESWTCVVLLVPMLAYGLLMSRLLRGKRRTGVVTRIVLAAVFAADIALRFLPFNFNRVYAIVPSILGSAIRLAMLVFVVLDLVFDRLEARGEETGEAA